MANQMIKLSDLQLSIMKFLWKHGKLSVNETHQLMNANRELALTTVATLLKRMHEKGVVDFEKNGRQYVYFALVSEKDVKTSMLSNMLAGLFDGKADDLVHHLVTQDDIAEDDLTKIRQLLSQENQK